MKCVHCSQKPPGREPTNLSSQWNTLAFMAQLFLLMDFNKCFAFPRVMLAAGVKHGDHPAPGHPGKSEFQLLDTENISPSYPPLWHTPRTRTRAGSQVVWKMSQKTRPLLLYISLQRAKRAGRVVWLQALLFPDLTYSSFVRLLPRIESIPPHLFFTPHTPNWRWSSDQRLSSGTRAVPSRNTRGALSLPFYDILWSFPKASTCQTLLSKLRSLRKEAVI